MRLFAGTPTQVFFTGIDEHMDEDWATAEQTHIGDSTVVRLICLGTLASRCFAGWLTGLIPVIGSNTGFLSTQAILAMSEEQGGNSVLFYATAPDKLPMEALVNSNRLDGNSPLPHATVPDDKPVESIFSLGQADTSAIPLAPLQPGITVTSIHASMGPSLHRHPGPRGSCG